jgi:hypothetical protein
MTRRPERPNLSEALRQCWNGITFYEPTLRLLTKRDLYEYAMRRIIRDTYIKHPQTLAADIREYEENYLAWWERWRQK